MVNTSRYWVVVAGALGAAALLHCGGAEATSSDHEATGGGGNTGTLDGGTGGSDPAGGGGSDPDPGTGGSGGGGTGTGGSEGTAGSSGGTGIPPHRPTAIDCPVSPLFGLETDGGTVSCTTNSDCQDAGSFKRFCLQHACGADQCFTDDDCEAGFACGCANQFGGNALHTNLCVPSSCRLDADCTASGLCSPAHTAYCGSLSGYHCRSAADTCQTDADCAGLNDGGLQRPYTCSYQPAVGHWQCAPITVCAG
jgi:hypothetical protein